MEVIIMHVDTITLEKGGRLPSQLLHELHIKEKEPLTVIHGKIGIIIIKQKTNLTDFLTDLVTTKYTKWDESEYSQYLLKRTK